MKKRGFTLIEVVISMVIIAIVMYAVIAVFITSGSKGVNVEVFTIAQSLAEGKLEQVMALPYASIETESEKPFTDELEAYTYEVSWAWVEPGNFDKDSVTDQGYIRVLVKIRHPNLDSSIQLQSVRADY